MKKTTTTRVYFLNWAGSQDQSSKKEEKEKGAGLPFIMQRFWQMIIVYFSISRVNTEDFGNNLLYILYMGRGGAVSWTVRGPRIAIFLLAVYCSTANDLFSTLQSWWVRGRSETENVSRMNQVFHSARDEVRCCSNNSFSCRRETMER